MTHWLNPDAIEENERLKAITPKPEFDYANMPYLPSNGVKGNGVKLLTRGLFLETSAPEHQDGAIWCLYPEEVFAHGKWYPSARKVYLAAADEYDAAKKITGSITQWQRICEMIAPKNMAPIIQEWRDEHEMIQLSALRKTLVDHVRSGANGYVGAARILIDTIKNKQLGKKAVGRPKKTKDAPYLAGSVDEDIARMNMVYSEAM